MTRRFGEENLLVVSHDYNTFTKTPIDRLAKQFNTVTVLVRYNPIAEISNYLPIEWLQPYRKAAKIDRTDLPANVTVKTTSLVYLPTAGGYERLGPKHATAVENQVEQIDREFDLIHAHFTWTAGHAAAQVAKTQDIPLVITVHANRDRFLQEYTSGRAGVYETWRRADAVIRINKRDVPLLERYNTNVLSIPNGYSRDRYPLLDPSEARAQLGIDAATDLIFSLGELNRRKGYRYLIEAMKQVVEHRESVLCAIGGHGQTERELKRQVREAGLDDCVEILGFVPESELPVWMNACDVFCLPSLSEGNPTVMFEALGCGKPYIGSAVGGVREIITTDEYGLLCEPADPPALAARLLEGIEHDWNREHILTYAKQYRWENITQRIETVYAVALERGRGRLSSTDEQFLKDRAAQ